MCVCVCTQVCMKCLELSWGLELQAASSEGSLDSQSSHTFLAGTGVCWSGLNDAYHLSAIRAVWVTKPCSPWAVRGLKGGGGLARTLG